MSETASFVVKLKWSWFLSCFMPAIITFYQIAYKSNIYIIYYFRWFKITITIFLRKNIIWKMCHNHNNCNALIIMYVIAYWPRLFKHILIYSNTSINHINHKNQQHYTHADWTSAYIAISSLYILSIQAKTDISCFAQIKLTSHIRSHIYRSIPVLSFTWFWFSFDLAYFHISAIMCKYY